MIEKIKKININIFVEILFIISLIVQDVDAFQFFGTPLYKYFILMAFFLLVFDTIINKRKIRINKVILSFMAIIYLYLFIFRFDRTVLVPSVFFVIEYITFFLYIQSKTDVKELMQSIAKIILCSATVIAIFAVIQLVSHKLNIKFIVDFISQKEVYLGEGRYSSIYTEPAHLCTIISSAITVSVYYIMKYKNKIHYLLLALFVFVGIISGSVVVYLSMFVFFVLTYFIIFSNRKGNKLIDSKKIKYVTLIIVATSVFSIVAFQREFVTVAWNKFESLFSEKKYSIDEIKEKDDNKPKPVSTPKPQNDNPSKNQYSGIEREKYEEHTKEQNEILYLQVSNSVAYAFKSNLHIGIEKLKDGYYLGTGMFTHVVYYDYYMTRLYPDGYYRLNYTDGCSMFLRVFSEFGIVGLVIYMALLLYLLIKGIMKKNGALLFIFFVFITQSMRLGEYNWVLNCLSFVVLLSFIDMKKKYYLCFNETKKNKGKRK